ncbi:magnesium transporter [Sphingomonadales bacterium 58]|uniref:magnesium transporter n=1 Tax=Sphingobium sp. S8 TaxID=2758385 RepID=UPI00065C6F65|nr:magnesium transporter [Sphingobium sp. S8]MBY2958983.1 magnesium transporter [Sphingomonadales bacterium 58]CAD7338180.1 Magnesium transporter MgtE [Sphingobium sp. S8]
MTNDLIADVRDFDHSSLHLADIVEGLQRLRPVDAAEQLALMSDLRAVDVLNRPEFEAAPQVLALLPTPHVVRLVAHMSQDRAADVIAAMGGKAEPILDTLPPAVRHSLTTLLAWPQDTAGGMMTTEYVAVPVTATVAEALDHIRTVERTRETVYSVFLIDEKGKLGATVSLRRLISAGPDTLALALARNGGPVTVSPTTDREVVADLIRRHDLLALPVVDEFHRLLGIVTVDDVLDALIAEHTEDAQKFGGVEALDRPYLETGFIAMIRKRAGWLAVLFLSEMLTASAMQHFEAELAKAVVLTLFIPLIMSSGGNSGSQATSLIIRALALGQLRLRDWWRVALRELPAGVVLGTILGTIGLARIALWQLLGFYDYGPHWELIGATVAVGLVGIVTFGSIAGAMLPFTMKRLGFDPASSSAPFVATLVDVTGLVIYFSIALVILSGTVL